MRSTSGVEMSVPSSSASASLGAAMANLRGPSIGIDTISQRSMPMITRPQASAIGSARIPLIPTALARANHMETAATPLVMRMAQPRLSNLARSLGTSVRTSSCAPARASTIFRSL